MTKLVMPFLLVIFLCSFNHGCTSTEDVKIQYPRFSPTNDRLIFNYCRPNLPCTIGIYELSSGGLSVYEAPANEFWFDPNYSSSGRQITFAVGQHSKGEGQLFIQIAIINIDGTGFQKITDSPYFKSAPSFSPDGQRIIYARANSRVEGTRKPMTDFEIYEVNVRTHVERRLTNLRFYSVSAPFYFPDGKRFIFSGEAARSDGKTAADFQRYRKQYQEQYQENTIFVMDGEQNELRPAFLNGQHSNHPSISADGSKIVFVSKTNEMDNIVGKFNFDLFIRIAGGNKRLTHLGTYMNDAILSPDGALIAFLSDKERNRKETLLIMNSDGTGVTQIKLPKESTPIQKVTHESALAPR